MHKAIAIIQFKLEGQLLRRHKEFHMEDRCLLHRINPEKGTVTLADGKEYPMLDTEFSTIDWKHPYELTPGELDVMERLERIPKLRKIAESYAVVAGQRWTL